MFSRSDADALRARLPALEFTRATENDSLLDAYRSHYGLNFQMPGIPASHSIGTFGSGEYTLVGQRFALPEDREKGCVVLLHGYYDHAGLFGHLIRHCLEQGQSVLIFDFPGHGLSTGPEASIRSFQEYSDALLQFLKLAGASLPVPLAVIGQSTGSAVVMDTLLHRPGPWLRFAITSCCVPCSTRCNGTARGCCFIFCGGSPMLPHAASRQTATMNPFSIF